MAPIAIQGPASDSRPFSFSNGYAHGWAMMDANAKRNRLRGILRPKVLTFKYDENGNRQCLGCKKHLSKKMFAKNPSVSDGLDLLCRLCRRSDTYKRKYGLSLEDYQNLISSQHGRCACCGKELNMKIVQQRVIDHDHKTGKVRGIICGRCNVVCGVLENEKLVQQGTAYLSKSNKCLT